MKRALALSVLSGILYAAAQPPLDLGALAFVALVPLLAASVTSSAQARLLAGGVAGTVAGVGCVGTSVYEAARLYFAQPAWASALFALLVPLVYGAPYFALFALAAGPACRDRERIVRPLLVVAAAWAASEYLRANVWHGTPWCLLAHSQMDAPALLQTASFGGAFAVSFVIALANAAVFACVPAIARALPARALAGRVAVAGGLLAAAVLYGRSEIGRWSAPAGRPLRVAIVQPNVPAEWRDSLARVPEILRRLTNLTRTAAASDPSLVVWPENAVGFAVEANTLSLRDAGEALPDGAKLLLGAPRSVIGQGGDATFRNAAFLVDRDGAILASQDKRRLTPFAEEWPAELPRPAGRRDAYRPGERVTLLDVDGVPTGVLICSESIYPELARDLVAAGAHLVVNISNDAWFGRSPAPVHHLNAVRLRAVELRRFIVRSTNTGLSAVIAPTGALTAEAPPGKQAVATADVVPIGEDTLYARFGDLFAWISIAFIAVEWLLRGRRDR